MQNSLFFTGENLAVLCLLATFIVVTIIQLWFYLFFFLRLARFKTDIQEGKTTDAVSIILAAKNERENLEKYLPLILEQDYTKFEVIVVNNHSQDGTLAFLQNLNNPKLRCFDYKEKEGKKAALQYGIQQAKYDCLLLTDADCKVNSSDWISEMAGKLTSEKEIVLGHGRFFKTKSLLNSIIRFESFLVATQYFSFALRRLPYMGVGRNLAYRKQVVQRSKVFKKYDFIKSGDDDLLVNEVGNANNVEISISVKSHTLSKGESDWKSYFNQKRRQLQAGAKYKLRDRLLLAFFGASNFMYYVLLVILIVKTNFIFCILGIFVIKQLLQYIVFRRISKQLGDSDLMMWIPALEPLYMMIISIIGVSTWVWKVNKWK